ncbi:MAG: hypothetical protein M1812_003556 [Candelaria pacifica]|nr:MAG: hypothetical protein M1812_003556 [Candelaria pacifica]
MAGISQHQNVFRIAKRVDSINNDTQPRVKKRNRQALSCSSCRTRKLKCDREVPCACCLKRGDGNECDYASGSQAKRKSHSVGAKASEAQVRLQKLEEMVTSMMRTTRDGSSSNENTLPSNSILERTLDDLSIVPDTNPGLLDIQGSETNYRSPIQWEAILTDVRAIQSALSDTDALPESDDTEEYESFLADPKSVSFLWISILFSAMQIGTVISQASSGQEAVDSSGSSTVHPYFIKAGQALIMGNYQKALPYSVEAVLLYGICKYMRKEDPDPDAWMLMGIAARLAMKMGYHRDPQHLTNISPFEGEMRRRTFYIIEGYDLLLSFQAGLPGVIQEEEYDTAPPSNLLDADFGEDCDALPLSRPSSDPTPMLYFCYKSRLIRIFRRILRHASAFKAPSFKVTMKLDHELHMIWVDAPPSLRMKPIASSIADQSWEILHRLYVRLVYLKSLCVLHRRYLSFARSKPEFEYSRTTCTSAALEILDHQAEMHAACQPGCQFHSDKWMLSSLTNHNYLLAAMILSLDIIESYRESPTTSSRGPQEQAKVLDRLRSSHDIWASRREFSRDARRASTFLASLLSRLPRLKTLSDPSTVQHPMPCAMQGPPDSGNQTKAKFDADIPDVSTGHMKGLNVSAEQFPPIDLDFTGAYDPGPISTIFSESEAIDWALLDQFLHDSSDPNTSFSWQTPNG